MIKDISTLFALISLLFIFLYTLFYIIIDLSYFFNSSFIDDSKNKIIFYLKKYNYLLLFIILVSSSIHAIIMCGSTSIINSGYVCLFILFFIGKIVIKPFKKIDFSLQTNLLVYLLLASVLVHLFLK